MFLQLSAAASNIPPPPQQSCNRTEEYTSTLLYLEFADSPVPQLRGCIALNSRLQILLARTDGASI